MSEPPVFQDSVFRTETDVQLERIADALTLFALRAQPDPGTQRLEALLAVQERIVERERRAGGGT